MVNGKFVALPEGEDSEEFSGPIKNRSCKDVICLILFVAFCIVGAIYLIVAWATGDVNRLVHGYDKYGNICGKDNEQLYELANSGQDKTNLRFFDVQNRECLESCGSNLETIGFKCFPKVQVEDQNVLNFFEKIRKSLEGFGENIRNSWQHILASCFIGLGISVVIVLLLRFLAGPMVWATILIVAGGSVAGSIALWIIWANNKTVKDAQWLLIGAIIVTVLAFLIIALLIALRNRIKLVIQLFEEASKAVAAIPLLLLQPVWTLLFLILVVLVWFSGWVGILSSGSFVQNGEEEVKLEMHPVISGMRVYHVFGFLWVTQFVVACQSVTIAGAVASWYFSRRKSNLGSPILSSISRLIRYHLGSVAFGSLVIAIVQMIRVIMKYLEKKIANTSGSLKSFFCCCQCCLGCFEKFLKYLNRNAYIEIAIYGYGFCKAAQKAFVLLASNALRVATLNFVGDFVLFLCKIVIVAVTILIGREMLKTNPNIDSMVPSLIVIGIITFLIAYCFLSVYEMTIDTLFLCFCEDCERNDGINKPYFMSRGLMRFVENSKKALEILEEAEKNKGYKKIRPQSINTIQIPPNHQYPQSPTSADLMEEKMDENPLNSSSGSGMTPLLPAYQPTFKPPTPDGF